jgi:hypothetical protein
MLVAAKEAKDYAELLVPMTAREYVSRYEPHLLNQCPEDVELTLQCDTDQATAVASKYNIQPAADGRLPRVIWDIATAVDLSHLRGTATAA